MSGLLSERTQRAEARLVEEIVTARSRADIDRLYNWRALVKDRRLVLLGDVHSLYVLFLKHGHGDGTALPPQSRYTPGEMVHFMVDETNPRMVPLTSPSFMERWAETVESNADKRARTLRTRTLEGAGAGPPKITEELYEYFFALLSKSTGAVLMDSYFDCKI